MSVFSRDNGRQPRPRDLDEVDKAIRSLAPAAPQVAHQDYAPQGLGGREETKDERQKRIDFVNLKKLEAELVEKERAKEANLDELAQCVATLTWEEMQAIAQFVSQNLSKGDAKVDEYMVAASLNAWKNAWLRPPQEPTAAEESSDIPA